MPAKIIVIRDENEWNSIRQFLQQCGEGAIVLSPETARQLEYEGFSLKQLQEEGLDDYNFSIADVALDVAGSPAHFAVEQIREEFG